MYQPPRSVKLFVRRHLPRTRGIRRYTTTNLPGNIEFSLYEKIALWLAFGFFLVALAVVVMDFR